MDASRAGGDSGGPLYRGELRSAGAPGRPGAITLGDAALTVGVDGSAPVTIAYRDLVTIAVGQGVGLLVVGEGPGAERWLLDRFGPGLGPLVGALRERRLRQLLGDDVISEEGEEDLLKLAGVSEAAQTDNVFRSVRARAPWVFGQSRHRFGCFKRDPHVRRLDHDACRARGADADRRLDGRQCGHASAGRRRPRHCFARSHQIQRAALRVARSDDGHLQWSHFRAGARWCRGALVPQRACWR